LRGRSGYDRRRQRVLLFQIADADRVSSQQQKNYDTLSKTQPLSVGMDVEKIGRTTGHTKGTVIARSFGFEPVIYDLDIIGGKKIVWFPDVYAVKGKTGVFSDHGDSGSLVTFVDAAAERFSVGLVFASTGSGSDLTLVTPIDKILNYFGVTLVSGHNT
jgi:hypothetical protein